MNYQDFLLQQGAAGDYFWYAARQGLIGRLLGSVYAGHAPARRLLDIGCGTGAELAVLARFGQAAGVDADQAVVDLARQQGLAVEQLDLAQESLPAGQYEVVTCFDVLEHFEDDQAALGKIYRGLASGGHFFFTVPAFPGLFSQHDRVSGHYRRYRQAELKNKLKQAGFSQIELYYWNVWLFLPIACLRFLKKGRRDIIKGDKPQSDAVRLPAWLNHFLFLVLGSEAVLFRKVWLPFGLTIYGVAKK